MKSFVDIIESHPCSLRGLSPCCFVITKPRYWLRNRTKDAFHYSPNPVAHPTRELRVPILLFNRGEESERMGLLRLKHMRCPGVSTLLLLMY